MKAPAAALTARLQAAVHTQVQRVRGVAERFDARAQRERVLLLAAGLAVVWLAADALWLTPATRAWQQARQARQAAQASTTTLNTDIQRVTEMRRAQTLLSRNELALWRDRVRSGEAALREHETTLVGPERMLPLLQELLTSHGRVRVRAMQSLPREDLLAAATSAATPATAPSPEAASASGPASGPPRMAQAPSLYRHGVELTLEGSFADLLAYLQALDALPQRLLWGGMQFKVEKHPDAVLTLRLWTLSLERHFIEI
jgi:MSHA biogenesis protein MshJ